MVDVVFLKVVILVVALFVYPVVHSFLDMAKIFRVAGRIPHLLNRFQDHALLIIPFWRDAR